MMGGEWGNGRRGMMGGGCPMIAFGDDGETTTFIDGRLAFLKAELKIIDAQKAAWATPRPCKTIWKPRNPCIS